MVKNKTLFFSVLFFTPIFFLSSCARKPVIGSSNTETRPPTESTSSSSPASSGTLDFQGTTIGTSAALPSNNESPDEDTTVSGTSPTAETLPPIKAPSKQELEYEQNRFSAEVQKFSSWEKIDFVRLSSGRFSLYNLDVTDTSEIHQWVKLAKAMKITAVAFEPHGGTLGYELSFHSGEQSISLGGGFVDGYIYVSGDNCTKVMLRIDNYSDLKETFEALQKTAGFPKPE